MGKLSEMRSRYNAGFSPEDRKLLEMLHEKLFNKRITITGCADCYRDAYIIIINKLKKLGSMPTPSAYVLKRGAMLYDADNNNHYVSDIPTEVAERLLLQAPERIKLFQSYPKNWELRLSQLKKKLNKKAEEAPKETEAPAETEATTETEAPAEAEE